MFRQALIRFSPAGNTSGCGRTGMKKALLPVLFFQHSMSSQGQVPKAAAIAASPPSLHKSLSKNLNLFSSSIEATATSEKRPLAVILNWMLAKRRHVMKYGDFYRDQGFDVLSVHLTPLQLLWPTTGAQLVADEVLKFLVDTPQYDSVLVHGFSVGGYLYGEMLAKMQDDPSKYDQLASKIIGQVFDSAVDFYNIPTGLAKAITNNRSFQKWLQMYISYHMRLFHISSTQHYLRSSEVFHKNPIRCPSLFLFSRDDPVGSAEGNMSVINSWEKMGNKVFVKCWDSSPHVGHLHHHPTEYMEELAAYLQRIEMLKTPFAHIRKASKL